MNYHFPNSATSRFTFRFNILKINNFIPLLAVILSLFVGTSTSQAQTLTKREFNLPSAPLQQVVNQDKKISTRLSADRQWLAMLTPNSHPSIKMLANRERKLAGLRLSPTQLVSSRVKTSYRAITLINLTDKDRLEIQVPLTKDALITQVKFSPNSQNLSYVAIESSGAYIYLFDIKTKQNRLLDKHRLNGAMGLDYIWLNSSDGIIVRQAVTLPSLPTPTEIISPNVSETSSQKAPRRTYQDLLQNTQDEAEFTLLSTSRINLIMLTGTKKVVTDTGIFHSLSLSPDGQYLLTKRLTPPFSYSVKYYDFAHSVEVYHLSSATKQVLAQLPSGEFRPAGFDSVTKGPRMVHWRQDKPNTLAYLSALDNGDINVQAEYRDQLVEVSSPFNKQPKPLVKTPWRIIKVEWGEDGLVMLTQREAEQKLIRQSIFDTHDSKAKLSLWNQKAIRDSYNDLGTLYTHHSNNTAHNHDFPLYSSLFRVDEGQLFTYGLGASASGYQPFIDRYTIEKNNHTTTVSKRDSIWRSATDKLESVRYIVKLDPLTLIINRQSSSKPNQLILLNVKSGKEQILYDKQQHPSAYQGVVRKLITYKRADGVPLSGVLYLPANYSSEQGTLPTLMWAYPREYKDPKVAGQVNYSPHQYNYVSPKGPIPFVANGYAIFDRVAMPIVGSGDKQPNDSFREQLIANAEAAIATLVEMGIADRERVAIGGHSYGAFMVANLLAHSDLFSTGIARSGAYNRSLTPFGFQGEKRNFWEAPSLYQQISPFTHADKIDEPLLLMHGEMDSNSGTYPMQSTRLFQAIKGLGGHTRLVTFPYESHSYKAKESIMHMLWEQEQWLKRHLQ